mmetsp:Transcript_23331/g.51540  ORF Transcript_23331/g.51540 Transcript_23331/m.51540 type:complete len:390 (-) Transcript_23331:112-1281(-)
MQKSRLPVVYSGVDLVTLGGGEEDDEEEESQDRPWIGLARQSSATGSSNVSCAARDRKASYASSTNQYADPAQTLIFFDWDDTLFPTTDLFDRIRLSTTSTELDSRLSPEAVRDMKRWEEALRQYLTVACSLGDRCCIVTNSIRPWVSVTIQRFAPSLIPLFNMPNGPRIIYANEALEDHKDLKQKKAEASCGSCTHGFKHWLREMLKDPEADDEVIPQCPHERALWLTDAKHAAMKREATAFYSRYAGQTWKNVLSLGDMKYEHEAMARLSLGRFSLMHPRERMRTKAILVPRGPTIRELTWTLEFTRLMLPAYVRFDGNIDLDLGTVYDPLASIGEVLHMQALSSIAVPRGPRGLPEVPPDDEAANEALTHVTMAVHDWLCQWGGFG